MQCSVFVDYLISCYLFYLKFGRRKVYKILLLDFAVLQNMVLFLSVNILRELSVFTFREAILAKSRGYKIPKSSWPVGQSNQSNLLRNLSCGLP